MPQTCSSILSVVLATDRNNSAAGISILGISFDAPLPRLPFCTAVTYMPRSFTCTYCSCRLEQRYSWAQYWNYLRRQLFVLDTYATSHNRALNLVMAAVHAWASSAAAAPVLAGVGEGEGGRGSVLGTLGWNSMVGGRCLQKRAGGGQAWTPSSAATLVPADGWVRDAYLCGEWSG